MKNERIQCIVCPIGCEITVEAEGENITEVLGSSCARGVEYAKQEYLHPERILTTTVKAENFYLPVVSVRTDIPVPKDSLFKCMDEIKKVCVRGPFKIGQVVIPRILGTEANVVIGKC